MFTTPINSHIINMNLLIQYTRENITPETCESPSWNTRTEIKLLAFPHSTLTGRCSSPSPNAPSLTGVGLRRAGQVIRAKAGGGLSGRVQFLTKYLSFCFSGTAKARLNEFSNKPVW
jgi:hypothetical protein